MHKLVWKQGEIIEFSEADKTHILSQLKHKSISEEHAINQEVSRRIKHEIEVMANPQHLKLEKDGDQYYLDAYGVKFYYPGPDGKLSGHLEGDGVAYEFIKKLLLKCSNHVQLKVSDNGVKTEYYKGQEELDPDLFDKEKMDRDEFLS